MEAWDDVEWWRQSTIIRGELSLMRLQAQLFRAALDGTLGAPDSDDDLERDPRLLETGASTPAGSMDSRREARLDALAEVGVQVVRIGEGG
jgi:hypothetical protein